MLFNSLNSWHVYVFVCNLLIFFQSQHFRNILLGITSESQIVRIQIKPDKMSGLIWVRTICKRLISGQRVD